MKTKIRKSPRYFLIEEETFKILKVLIVENNKIHTKGKYHLKLDIAAYFIHYISYIALKRKDSLKRGYVSLMANILEKQHYKYKSYIDFLFLHGLIDIIEHSKKNHIARKYKVLTPPKKKSKRRSYIRYSPIDFCFKREQNKEYNNKTRKANKSCSHLVKWLTPENLTIQYEEALNYINNMEEVDSKKISRRYAIEMLHQEIIYYQRDGKDNRFHYNLTSFPKDLRPFIKFKGNQPLLSFDIKSSQPYLLAGVLNLILNKDVDKIKELCSWIVNPNLRKRIYTCLITMIEESFEPHVIKGIQEFIRLITEGDIYNHISANYSEEFLFKIQTPLGISDKVYCKHLRYKITKHFKTIRDYSKMVMLEYLYCTKNSPEKRNKEVRRILPTQINELVDNLKSTKKEDFPIFLQNVESKLILDIITKEIATEFPDAPLYTIHDSVATTEEYKEVVKNKMVNTLTDYFGIAPKIEMEEW